MRPTQARIARDFASARRPFAATRSRAVRLAYRGAPTSASSELQKRAGLARGASTLVPPIMRAQARRCSCSAVRPLDRAWRPDFIV